jgi:hypothetical protein
MAHHKVQLEYINGVVHPNPEPLVVDSGDTVSFVLTSPPNGQFKIKFDKPVLFSASEFKHGDGPVTIYEMPGPTTYACELLIDGVAFETTGSQGGSMKPPK